MLGFIKISKDTKLTLNLEEGKMPSHEVRENTTKYNFYFKLGLLASLKYHEIDN